MGCSTVADLNDLVQQGRLSELIRVNEALHERSFSQIADQILQREAKAVLLAGPSSSGKTTSANRLAVQLRVRANSLYSFPWMITDPGPGYHRPGARREAGFGAYQHH